MAVKKTARKGKALPMLKDSAYDIWLAGLGAFAMAGEEGNKLFRALVKKGETMEKTNKARLNQIVARAEGLQGEARDMARTTVGRFTTPIETGMATAMNRLGVPSRKEIQTLTKRVEELTRVVARKNGAARKARVRRSAAPTPTA